MKIYLDILLITNTVVSLICIEATAKICRKKTYKKTLYSAAIIGGFTSLLIVIPGSNFLNALMITTIKLLSYPIIVKIAFKTNRIKELIKLTIIFVTSNLVYTGIVLVLWELSDTKIIYIRNYTIYFNVSLFKITIAVVITYVILTLLDAVKKNTYQANNYSAKYVCGNYHVTVPAVCDTGNKLTDNFSGTSVVIFYCDELFFHYSLDETDKLISGEFRLLPFQTINGSGIIPVTYKGEVEIINENTIFTDINCCVGITRSRGEKERAIFNPIILE